MDRVERHQSEHGVRSDSNVIRRETGVKLERTAARHGFPAAVHEAFERHRAIRVRLLLLQLRLDVIERQREEGGEETGDRGRAERGRETGDLVRRHHFLGLVVRREHAHVQRHRANARRPGAGE